VTALPAPFAVFPAVAKPWNTKSFAVTVAGLLHTKPLTMVVLAPMPTQKSCSGSASDAIAVMGDKAICSTRNAIVIHRTLISTFRAIITLKKLAATSGS
jgi:hypothetical protein